MGESAALLVLAVGEGASALVVVAASVEEYL
jgi:hypothetical protein